MTKKKKKKKMNNLLTELFPLDSLYEHISEFVRIDEHLRMKQLFLETITPESFGWTFVAGQEINEHKKLIKNIRCFLHYHAKELFGEDVKMFSKKEYEKIKLQKDVNYNLYETLEGYDLISNENQFWFFIRALNDKENTMNFYQSLLENIFKSTQNVGEFISAADRIIILKNFLSKCVFSLT